MPAVQKAKQPTPSFETAWVDFQEVKKAQKEAAIELKEAGRLNHYEYYC